MKNRLQIIPIVATLCAGGWFTFWLFAFQPLSKSPNPPAFRPPIVTHLNEKACHLREVRNPTHFALPSVSGFSGPFPETCVVLRLALEKPVHKTWFLSPENTRKASIDLDWLLPNIALPQRALLIPNATTSVPNRSVDNRPRLTFSPNLVSRVESKTVPPSLMNEALPSSVRIHLIVCADGSVRHALLETPTTNQTLLRAIRQLQFKPIEVETIGWADFLSTKESVH